MKKYGWLIELFLIILVVAVIIDEGIKLSPTFAAIIEIGIIGTIALFIKKQLS